MDALLALLADRVAAHGRAAVCARLACEHPEEIVSSAAALRFKRAVRERPRLVGLIGGASVGKSLLFNSLAGARISRVHYEPHTSHGPVALVHRADWEKLQSAQASLPTPFELLAGSRVLAREQATGLSGYAEQLHAVLHDDDVLRGLILLDLPDITSVPAATHAVARRILPWLDGALVMTGCDRLNDYEYGDYAKRLSALGLWSWGVLNNLEGEKLTDDALKIARERFASLGATSFYLLPFLERDPDFVGRDGDFTRLRGDLRTSQPRADESKLAAYLRTVAAPAAAAMKKREELVATLRRKIDALAEAQAARLPRLAAPEELVAPDLRSELDKIGYNPLRWSRWIRRWLPSSTVGRDFDVARAEERYRKDLKDFENALRALLQPHAALAPQPDEFQADLRAAIDRLKSKVNAFVEQGRREFEGGRTKRRLYESVRVALPAFIVLDFFVFPGMGVTVASAAAWLVMVLYPELRGPWEKLKAELEADLRPVYRAHVGRLAAAAHEALSKAVPTDPELRRAIEEMR